MLVSFKFFSALPCTKRTFKNPVYNGWWSLRTTKIVLRLCTAPLTMHNVMNPGLKDFLTESMLSCTFMSYVFTYTVVMHIKVLYQVLIVSTEDWGLGLWACLKKIRFVEQTILFLRFEIPCDGASVDPWYTAAPSHFDIITRSVVGIAPSLGLASHWSIYINCAKNSRKITQPLVLLMKKYIERQNTKC